MKTLRRYFTPWVSFLFLLGLTAGCTPKPAIQPQSRIAQPHVIELLQAVNAREDSLLCARTQHADPFIRQLAAMHAASYTDTLLCDCLSPLLNDSIPDVRQAAAYALGQFPAMRCQAALDAHLESETHAAVRYALFTAAGKHAQRFTKARIEALYALPSAPCEDAVLAFAFTARLHGTTDLNSLAQRCLSALACSDLTARQHAAWVFAILSDLWPSENQKALVERWRNETDLTVAVPLTRALRNVNVTDFSSLLDSVLREAATPDAIRIELLRLPSLAEAVSIETLTALLVHPQPGIPALAGKQIQKHLSFAALDLRNLPPATTTESRVTIAELRCAATPSDCTDLMTLAHSSQAWERVGALAALPSYLGERALLAALKDTAAVVKSTAAEVLLDRLSNGQIRLNYPDSLRTALLKTRDSGVIAVLATHLSAHPRGLTDTLLSSLATYAQELALPREAETYGLITGLLESVGHAYKARTPAIPLAIDFKYLAALGDTVVCEIVTNAGTLRCELYPLYAPASVYSFLTLAEAGYYDNKSIHRVVPQFVIQSGCPRGDGWGGVDYIIRSEFALGNYREGSMGMASAGHDTESCQWFITHTATPHLNGRYSIFGQVIEGLDVVQATQRGDRIQHIRRVAG
jgi:cyclophilin family peptidyl-prolyl cis-trans isomerase